MRSRGTLFWQSLFVTLLLVLPMVGGVWYFSIQRTARRNYQEAAADKSDVAVTAGAQNTLRLLVAVQGETPAFLLVRLDAPARAITLCGLPDQTVVTAPEGETTLAACYMTAGPARVTELLGDTLDATPDGYYAATAETYAALAGGTDTTVRFDTAAVFTAEQRAALGLQKTPVAELTADDAEAFLSDARRANLTAAQQARLRAALWAAILRQNPALGPALPAAMRGASAKTLTNLTAQALYTLQDTLDFFHSQPAATVEYTVLPGTEQPTTGEYRLTTEGLAQAKKLLG